MPEWLSVISAIASILGLGAAIWAALKATSAAQAANEARRAIQQQTLVERLGELQQRADLVEAALKAGETTSGRYLARELHRQLVELCARHAEHSPHGVRQGLLAAKQYAAKVQRALGVDEPLSAESLPDLREQAHESGAKLAEALGHARAATDHPGREDRQ
jgi:hypothetical protein